MSIIAKYLKLQKKNFLLFGFFGFIFMLVFYVGKADISLVIYAFILCCFFGSVLLIIDIYRFYKKHKLLEELKPNINLCIDELPAVQDSIEEQYQEIIRLMHQQQMDLLSANDHAKTDMINYYTLWVHQIKTPISALRILLQSEPIENRVVLENELFKIEQYVEMVLSYLRLGSNTTDYKIEKYPLDRIIKQAIRKYARLFIQKKLTLIYDYVDEMILTDEKWLLFVIEQVLSNSLKYTKSGKISIYMEPNQVLVIEDTGIGIAPEDTPRVFEKGFTGYNGRDDKKSTGLGLYLCKLIMNRLGHGIQIESEIGKGTKVRLYLATVTSIYE
ncbi:MAG: sensor histidine kinase [Clostridiales bacterium]|nr:sensor histidine kinase [Clostridiales bacterium]